MGWYKQFKECMKVPPPPPLPPITEIEKDDPRHGVPLDFFIEAPTINAVVMRLKFELSAYDEDYKHEYPRQYKYSYFSVPVTQVGSEDTLELFVKGDLMFEVVPEMPHIMNIKKISVYTPEYLQKYIDSEWGTLPIRDFLTYCPKGGSFTVTLQRSIITYNI